jgi:hypothetical protein
MKILYYASEEKTPRTFLSTSSQFILLSIFVTLHYTLSIHVFLK